MPQGVAAAIDAVAREPRPIGKTCGGAVDFPAGGSPTSTGRQRPSVTLPVRLRGPGDATLIRIPVRLCASIRARAPPISSRTTSPAFEFDRPDFPWLFTLARAGASGRLRPWLCLAVVRRQEGVVLRPATSGSAVAGPGDRRARSAVRRAPGPGRGLGVGARAGGYGRPPRHRRPRGSSGLASSGRCRGCLCPRVLAADTDYVAAWFRPSSWGARPG